MPSRPHWHQKTAPGALIGLHTPRWRSCNAKMAPKRLSFTVPAHGCTCSWALAARSTWRRKALHCGCCAPAFWRAPAARMGTHGASLAARLATLLASRTVRRRRRHTCAQRACTCHCSVNAPGSGTPHCRVYHRYDGTIDTGIDSTVQLVHNCHQYRIDSNRNQLIRGCYVSIILSIVLKYIRTYAIDSTAYRSCYY